MIAQVGDIFDAWSLNVRDYNDMSGEVSLPAAPFTSGLFAFDLLPRLLSSALKLCFSKAIERSNIRYCSISHVLTSICFRAALDPSIFAACAAIYDSPNDPAVNEPLLEGLTNDDP